MRKRVVVAGERLLKWWNLSYVGISYLMFAVFAVAELSWAGTGREEILMGVTLESYFTTLTAGTVLTEIAVMRLRRWSGEPRRLLFALAFAPLLLPIAFAPFVALGMLFTWEPAANFPRAALRLGILHAILWELSLVGAWAYWRIQGGRFLPGGPPETGEPA